MTGYRRGLSVTRLLQDYAGSVLPVGEAGAERWRVSCGQVLGKRVIAVSLLRLETARRRPDDF